MNFSVRKNLPGLFLCILKIGMAIPITNAIRFPL